MWQDFCTVLLKNNGNNIKEKTSLTFFNTFNEVETFIT